MKLSDKEKLEKAIEFIKKIENLECRTIDIEEVLTPDARCDDCGSNSIDVNFIRPCRVIDPEVVENLKNQAWHLLVDLA